MKGFALLLVILAFTVIVVAEPQTRFLVVVKEYPKNEPVKGVMLNMTLQVDAKTYRFSIITNQVGAWGTQLASVPREVYLVDLSFSPANYTGYSYLNPSIPIRVADSLIEELDYRAMFDRSLNTTLFTGLRIPLQITQEGNLTILRCVIWLTPGKLVNVSMLDPMTRKPAMLTIKPGVPVTGRLFWSTYLLPIGYPVLLTATTPIAGAKELRVWITNDTKTLPWTYYAAEALIENQLREVMDLLRQLESIGYYTEDMRLDVDALKAVAQQTLFLFKQGNYTSAIGATLSLVNGASSLKSRVNSLFSYSHLAALGIIILTLAFAHTFSLLMFERGRKLHVLRFILLLILLSFSTATSSTIRLAAASLLGTLGVPLAILDVPTLIAATVVMGFLAYAIFLLLSFVAGPVRGFWLYLAVRYIKAKRLRSILILATMILVIASTLAVSGFTLGSTVIRKEWLGAGFKGLDVEVNLIRKPYGLNSSEIEWLIFSTDAVDIGRMAIIPERYPGVLLATREGTVGSSIITNLVAIDIKFAIKNFNLSAHVVEGRLPRDGEPEVVVSKTLSNILRVGESIWIFFAQPSVQGPPIPAGPVWDAPVKVVGFFDPLSLNSTLDPELRPLFGDYPSVTLMLIAPYNPLANRLSTSRVWLISENSTAVDLTARLTLASLPATVHILQGKRVITYERATQFSFKGTETILLLTIAALMNAAAMLGHAEDRRRDMYVIATLGANPKNLFYAMMTEATIIGVVSSYIGWAVAPLIIYVSSLLVMLTGATPISFTPLPVESLFYATAVGLAVVVISAYIPSRRVSGLSRMGREERKVISSSELKLVDGMAVYELPIRVSVFESEALYRYLKEILPKKDILNEELYLDGTFAFAFAFFPPHMRGSMVTCRLRTTKRGDSLTLLLEVPEEFRRYMYLSDVIYALENKLLDYSKWRDSQFRYQILRYAPRREAPTLDSLLERGREAMIKAREMELKLRRLDEMKATISASLYADYEKKYKRQHSLLIRELLTLSLRLESFVSQLRDEIRKLEIEIEKHRVAYELGEMKEEEYRKIIEPLKAQLDEYKDRIRTIEEINEFLASRRR
ncbi:MAG: FtsX-like permease family protein [Thermofilaceae archaeon]